MIEPCVYISRGGEPSPCNERLGAVVDTYIVPPNAIVQYVVDVDYIVPRIRPYMHDSTKNLPTLRAPALSVAARYTHMHIPRHLEQHGHKHETGRWWWERKG